MRTIFLSDSEPNANFEGAKSMSECARSVIVLAALFMMISRQVSAGEFYVISKDDPLLNKTIDTLHHRDQYKGICTDTEYSFPVISNDAQKSAGDEDNNSLSVTVAITAFECSTKQDVSFLLILGKAPGVNVTNANYVNEEETTKH